MNSLMILLYEIYPLVPLWLLPLVALLSDKREDIPLFKLLPAVLLGELEFGCEDPL